MSFNHNPNNFIQPHSLDRSYESGFKGLKQIWNSLKARKVKNRGDILSKYTSAFLDKHQDNKHKKYGGIIQNANTKIFQRRDIEPT